MLEGEIKMKKQNTNNLKYSILSNLLIIILISIVTSSCSNKQVELDKKEAAEKEMNQLIAAAKTSSPVFGTIKSIDVKNRIMRFDDLELITADKKERMKEIGITEYDFSNWYLYNASNEIKQYKIIDNVSITLYDKDTGNKITTNDINALYHQFEMGYENHYEIKKQGEYVIEIVQIMLNE